VLIADDDALSRRVLNDVLIDWGYQVIVARNGNEAWEILQEEDPPQSSYPGLDDAGFGRH